MCPAGTGAFLFLLFGPPARRAADGGLLGAAAPPRPPLHSPRTTPLGLSYIPHSHGLAFKGLPYPSVPRGLRGFCSGSFLAALGDLPARRAMPACASALYARPKGLAGLRHYGRFGFYKGQSLFHCLCRTATRPPSPAEHYPRDSKTRPKVQILRAARLPVTIGRRF